MAHIKTLCFYDKKGPSARRRHCNELFCIQLSSCDVLKGRGNIIVWVDPVIHLFLLTILGPTRYLLWSPVIVQDQF